MPDSNSISRELILSRDLVDIDLHWELLREGRLRAELTGDMMGRRRQFADVWTLSADDALFLLLVHPAFAKHLAGWEMGLHRVVDIDYWLQSQPFDWQVVRTRLEENGVCTAAWATLRWVQLLTCGSGFSRDRSGSYLDQYLWERLQPRFFAAMNEMMSELQPGRIRCAWLDRWLRSDLPERTSTVHWARLLGFSLFLHDTPRDSMRALAGRYRARRRSAEDLAVFQELLSEQTAPHQVAGELDHIG